MIACFALYLFKRSKKTTHPIFPVTPVETTLKGYGKGTLQLSEETLNFIPLKTSFSKKTETDKQIELIQVEKLDLKGNQVSVQSYGQTELFSFPQKLASQVYIAIKAAWDKQIQTLEKVAALPEQKQLKNILANVTKIVDSLFDILLHLHGEIDWKNIEGCLIRCEESSTTSEAEPQSSNLNLANLSAAVKQRNPELVARETRVVLQLLYEQVFGLHSENQSFEQFHPNYGDLKTATMAYYTLNDIHLGEAVGDADMATEKAKLVIMLNNLSISSKQTVESDFFAADNSCKAERGEGAANAGKRRSIFATQLANALNPDRT